MGEEARPTGSAGAALSARDAARFLGTTAIIVGLLFAFSRTEFYEESVRRPSLDLSASAAASIIALLGIDVVALGNEVRSSDFTLNIQDGCDALEPVALYSAAVLACPVAWGLRLIGLLGGALLLVAINQLRTVSLFLTGIHYPEAFDVLHLDVWQALFIFLGVSIWIGWAQWTLRVEVAGR
jgi:exosortase/archaeosortase family protein